MSDPVTTTLVTIAIAGFTIIAILHALSAALMHEVKVINLQRETARLHNEHAKRMAQLRAGMYGPSVQEADAPQLSQAA